VTGKHAVHKIDGDALLVSSTKEYGSTTVPFYRLRFMELYFGGIHLIVKKYLNFRKE
jgi:hypothetical protein